MNRDQLNRYIQQQFEEHILKLSDNKGGDYAGDEDALANFKQQAEDWGLTPVQVWGVFAGKHWSAVKTFVKEGDVKSEPIEGRLHDIILYCFLLLALNAEEQEKIDNPLISTPTIEDRQRAEMIRQAREDAELPQGLVMADGRNVQRPPVRQRDAVRETMDRFDGVTDDGGPQA